MTVLFTCHTCGLQCVRVEVPERVPGSDLKKWMDETMVLCGATHRRISSTCPSKHLDLAIPVSDDPNAGVGEKAPEIKDIDPKIMKSKGAN